MEYPVLVANLGLMDGQQWLLSDHVVIGRDAGSDIVVADRQVSRRHARVEITGQGAILEDLGSKNGTFLNGQKVEGRVRLSEGDEIGIAFVQSFIFLTSDATLPLADLPPEMAYAFKLRLDENSRRVWVRGVELDPPLSAQQFNLLMLLSQRDGEVVSREELMNAVWEEDTRWVTEQAFDALVRRLRERLNQVDPGYDYIVTVRGHGLRFENTPH
ncbi:MAG TPA: FHA domain-containing protein [Anaerolineaceae bacterium]|jgi:hypothetical protein|nr:FHA domain-containing protein [Anaerolineaceae bacterium]HPT24103.1 FHA domain-containing protein [Anaerolineaceae bacterium]